MRWWHPSTFSDVNGEYLGFDDKVHSAKGRVQYANFSGWDIYRCQVQLIAMLMPKVGSDMAQSLVVDSEQGGGLPRWSVANNEAGSMVGDPSDIILASIYAFGGRDFDTKTALKAMLMARTILRPRSDGLRSVPMWTNICGRVTFSRMRESHGRGIHHA